MGKPQRNALVAINGGKTEYDEPVDGPGIVGEPPEIVRSAIGQAGKIAARKLLTTLQSEEFDQFPPQERFKYIKEALDRAYGPSAARKGSGKVNLDTDKHVGLAETLARLHGKVRLPELGDD